MFVVRRDFTTNALRALRIFASLREPQNGVFRIGCPWVAQRREDPQSTQRSWRCAKRLLFLLICISPLTQAQGRPEYRSVQAPISSEAASHFQLAKSAEVRADWRTAESEYREALRLAPDWAEAMVNLGIVYNRQGKNDDALAAFTRAAEINPQLVGAQLNIAITHFRTKHFREAEGPLRRALAIEPENRQALELLVLTLFALEQYNEVVE